MHVCSNLWFNRHFHTDLVLFVCLVFFRIGLYVTWTNFRLAMSLKITLDLWASCLLSVEVQALTTTLSFSRSPFWIAHSAWELVKTSWSLNSEAHWSYCFVKIETTHTVGERWSQREQLWFLIQSAFEGKKLIYLEGALAVEGTRTQLCGIRPVLEPRPVWVDKAFLSCFQ